MTLTRSVHLRFDVFQREDKAVEMCQHAFASGRFVWIAIVRQAVPVLAMRSLILQLIVDVRLSLARFIGNELHDRHRLALIAFYHAAILA